MIPRPPPKQKMHALFGEMFYQHAVGTTRRDERTIKRVTKHNNPPTLSCPVLKVHALGRQCLDCFSALGVRPVRNGIFFMLLQMPILALGGTECLRP